ncbi:hypothetical protein DL762_004582 [Monosporascus cannonballus]|uniref:serine--tRNA ligase n=1 Tax=Monosporascus cannonballus TaxID=155416 RepID=A0ABY0HAE5_9PEZI|nr:hypothetical protein DL762_004582 [Monosporascus cannonballus]
MLDTDDFIEERGGNPNRIKESQRRRGASVELVDEVIEQWKVARAANYEVTQIGNQINAVQKQIGQKKKAKEDADDLIKQKEELQQRKKNQEDVAAAKNTELLAKVRLVGNYVHDSVPVSDTEDDNAVVRTWQPESFDPARKPGKGLSHHDVLWRLGGYDPIRGVKLVGHRGYCLTGYGMFLNMALINYAVEFLFKKGYTPNQPPFMLNSEQMAKTAQLSQFDEELYKVSEGENSTDRYLIATSEQPLSCLHAEEWLQPSQLPIKYCGYSTCFRKEAGSHGRDAWGIFRVHQFEKPDQSWQHFDDMIATSQEFYESLGLPYRVVSIVSSALNNAADLPTLSPALISLSTLGHGERWPYIEPPIYALWRKSTDLIVEQGKKYDLEAYFPFQSEYKELVSCSNCTDYQTRELEIRFGTKKNKNQVGGSKKEYVHALNATLCATERTLCCVLENYQTEDGFAVPEALRKYIPGQPEFIPFIKEPLDQAGSVTGAVPIPDRTKKQ